MHIDPQIVTLIFTIATALGVLLQAGILLGMFLVLRQTQKKLHGITDQLESHILPIVVTSRGLVEDLAPKAGVIASNLVESSNTLRAQTEQVKTVVEDVSARTRHQSERVDVMVTGLLNNVTHATTTLEKGIAAPLRQVSGVLNGLRAGLETLRAKDVAPVAKRARNGVPPVPPIASHHEAAVLEENRQARPYAVPEDDLTENEASAAAARFVRERSTASIGEPR